MTAEISPDAYAQSLFAAIAALEWTTSAPDVTRLRLASSLAALPRERLKKISRNFFTAPELRGILLACQRGEISAGRHAFAADLARAFGDSAEFQLQEDSFQSRENLVLALSGNTHGKTSQDRQRKARQRLYETSNATKVPWFDNLHECAYRLDEIFQSKRMFVVRGLLVLMASVLAGPPEEVLRIRDLIYPMTDEFVELVQCLERLTKCDHPSTRISELLIARLGASSIEAGDLADTIVTSFSTAKNRRERATAFLDALFEMQRRPDTSILAHFGEDKKESLIDAAVKVRADARRSRRK